jgi:predicted GIY-YIG superfamily endonuclease
LPSGLFTADVFGTGMTQNLKQRAYNHNRHREEGKSKDGNNHEGRNPEQ